ncbi:MAG TPA: hypothetical protein VH373_06840, partial [Jatrophihabitantaceae bacterium]
MVTSTTRKAVSHEGVQDSAASAVRIRAPARAEMAALAEQLRVALDLALDTVTWAAGFEFPDFQHDHEMMALV